MHLILSSLGNNKRQKKRRERREKILLKRKDKQGFKVQAGRTRNQVLPRLLQDTRGLGWPCAMHSITVGRPSTTLAFWGGATITTLSSVWAAPLKKDRNKKQRSILVGRFQKLAALTLEMSLNSRAFMMLLLNRNFINSIIKIISFTILTFY